MNVNMLRNLLKFTAIVEIGTGLALIIDPRFVVGLLVGPNLPDQDIPMGRLPGIAILALGVSCWPNGLSVDGGSPAVRGMLIYNVLIALFLVYLFKIGHLGGVLLWPGVVLHAVVALLLIWTWRTSRRVGAQT